MYKRQSYACRIDVADFLQFGVVEVKTFIGNEVLTVFVHLGNLRIDVTQPMGDIYAQVPQVNVNGEYLVSDKGLYLNQTELQLSLIHI